jgi:signal transduction histidine kinase/tetratricopeptide (TPR) repeat protein
LQWLALLVMAVVLPTGGLLWFMSRVIANERLVVQQKLATLYQDKLTDALAKTELLYKARVESLDKLKPTANPYALFRRVVLESEYQGLVVWAPDGSVVFPQSSSVLGTDVLANSPLAAAWREEFANHQYAAAVEMYERFVSSPDPLLAVPALVGKSRCLSRLKRVDEAIAQCQKAALVILPATANPSLRLAVENARLLLLSLVQQSKQPQLHAEVFRQTIAALTGDLFNAGGESALLPAAQNLFLAQKTLEAMAGPVRISDTKTRDRLEKLALAEELSISAAETLQPSPGVFDGFFKTVLEQKPVYALRHRTPSATLLLLFSDSGMNSVLSGFRDTFAGTAATYRILNAASELAGGAKQPKGKPFTVAVLPEGFPSWKAELYFEGGDVFEKAAHRQIAVYIWTGSLVILVVLSAALLAMRAVGRQIRLNRMKNDFIATVSHELKTPLASMRVLVDTLLEGNIRDEAQGKEYLRLTAKENERLSRMIDNFLTFSRMERNKKAFMMGDAHPAAIVNDAVESLRTKHAANQCHLTIEISDGLSEIHADHDAIVTVLVNLLDNACKYTTESKQVSLKVFAEKGFVCFAVSDNGIGIARRHLRKIFDSFYQVDSSLARKAEGCGLGLSIVKFIVDAHKGRITVESKVGSGSAFTVRLPVSARNGH